MKVSSIMLSTLFYTTDTYGTFSADYLDDSWFEESEFDGNGFMKDLANLHGEVINDVLPCGGVKSVEVLGTTSPREYNFATDQVDLGIEVDLPKLREYITANESEFEAFVKEHFTSRSGFWSYTPDNLRDFYGAVEGTSEEYDSEIDRDKCVAIMAGWYLSREALTEEEYLDQMFDKVSDIMWDNFAQFTEATYAEYDKYEQEIEAQNNNLTLPGLEQKIWPMDIEEWAREREKAAELELVNA